MFSKISYFVLHARNYQQINSNFAQQILLATLYIDNTKVYRKKPILMHDFNINGDIH